MGKRLTWEKMQQSLRIWRWKRGSIWWMRFLFGLLRARATAQVRDGESMMGEWDRESMMEEGGSIWWMRWVSGLLRVRGSVCVCACVCVWWRGDVVDRLDLCWCCSVLQCVLQCMMQCVATCDVLPLKVLQSVTVCCSVLQRVTLRVWVGYICFTHAPRHTAVQQQTATHRTTLQHTALRVELRV